MIGAGSPMSRMESRRPSASMCPLIGEIDWQQVADSGVEFAMIRLGYRGYSQGVIMPDKNF